MNKLRTRSGKLRYWLIYEAGKEYVKYFEKLMRHAQRVCLMYLYCVILSFDDSSGFGVDISLYNHKLAWLVGKSLLMWFMGEKENRVSKDKLDEMRKASKLPGEMPELVDHVMRFSRGFVQERTMLLMQQKKIKIGDNYNEAFNKVLDGLEEYTKKQLAKVQKSNL